MPERIQLRRTKGWRMPKDTVRVCRPTLWGNPFIHEDHSQAVSAFRRLLQGGTQTFSMGPGQLQFAPGAHSNTLHWAWSDWARSNMHTLRGKNLACWCRLGEPCHADVLLELANRKPDPEDGPARYG